MERFAILIKKRWGVKALIHSEVVGEEVAIRESHQLYKELCLQQVLIVDDNIKVIFKIERRCKCTSVQREFVLYPNPLHLNHPVWKCMRCGLVHLEEEVLDGTTGN